MHFKILFFLLLAINANAQNCGVATYNFKILDSEDTESPLFEMLRTDSELIEINLKFNQNYSEYKIKKLEGSTNLARVMAFGDNPVLYSKNENLFKYNNSEFMYIIPAKKYVVNKDNLNWTIHDDSKIINDLVCFKATSTYPGATTRGELTTRNVTAWFAPEINLQYGPAFFTGLPGLVLEVQYDTYFLLGLSKITYSDCNEIVIETNIKGENIDVNDFDKIQAEILKKEFENFHKNNP